MPVFPPLLSMACGALESVAMPGSSGVRSPGAPAAPSQVIAWCKVQRRRPVSGTHIRGARAKQQETSNSLSRVQAALRSPPPSGSVLPARPLHIQDRATSPSTSDIQCPRLCPHPGENLWKLASRCHVSHARALA